MRDAKEAGRKGIKVENCCCLSGREDYSLDAWQFSQVELKGKHYGKSRKE